VHARAQIAIELPDADVEAAQAEAMQAVQRALGELDLPAGADAGEVAAHLEQALAELGVRIEVVEQPRMMVGVPGAKPASVPHVPRRPSRRIGNEQQGDDAVYNDDDFAEREFDEDDPYADDELLNVDGDGDGRVFEDDFDDNEP
jgi:hypothetical protein